jgi:uncharacterized protein YbaR (Trm112 family)
MLIICPVCEHSLSLLTDVRVVNVGDKFYHGPCSKFAGFFATADECPVCLNNVAVQEGDIRAGRWWMACATCRLPVSRWADFPIDASGRSVTEVLEAQAIMGRMGIPLRFFFATRTRDF